MDLMLGGDVGPVRVGGDAVSAASSEVEARVELDLASGLALGIGCNKIIYFLSNQLMILAKYSPA